MLSGVFDAPARCMVQNMVQYNGFYGCPNCLTAGARVQTSAAGTTHAYPVDTANLNTGHGVERTLEATQALAKEADEKNIQCGKITAINGVKGSSWLLYLPGFNMINGIAVDYMHCVLLGVVKMLIKLWFDPSHKCEDFSISSRSDEINERIVSIKPPNVISRMPRVIADLANFKATEFKAFLLYYLVPLLIGILPDIYLHHLSLLVEAVFILLQETITMDDLEKARNLLIHFTLNMAPLYGKRYLTSNVHMLLHFTEKVKALGPLWCQSCFYFEDFNGELKNLFHGTQNIEMQIVSSVCVLQKIPEMVKSLPYGSSASEFYKALTSGSDRSKRTSILQHIDIVGATVPCELNRQDKAVCKELIGAEPIKCLKFKRICVNGVIVHCMDYRAVSRRESCTVHYMDKDGISQYGKITYFLKVYHKCVSPVLHMHECACLQPKYIARILQLEKQQFRLESEETTGSITLCNIVPVKRGQLHAAVYLQQIKKLCVFVNGTNDVDYICHIPNFIETH